MLVHWPASKPLGTLHTRKRIQLRAKMVGQSVVDVNKKTFPLTKEFFRYGYHGKDSYDNLHVLPSGEMLYFVATMVVIYNKMTNTQRHYTGHADDIKW